MNARAESPATFLAPLVKDKSILVCCGAGGVGKTTTSAALGLAAGLEGRRALVLTIDPARRLAEAMGIPAGSREPVPVPRDRLAAVAERYGAGVAVGPVDAWMLAPAVVFEDLVRRLAPDPERARVILSSRLYQHLTEVVAGMQEYTAAEALHALSSSGRYDLIVLDTPPSRNALSFLEAPRKLSMFLDERVLGLFLPGAEKRGLVYGGAASVVRNVFTRVLGETFWVELQEFLERFSAMFDPMRDHAGQVRELLRSDRTAFVLVTSPEPAALREAAFFEAKLRELVLPFEGTVLNRSWAYTRGLEAATAGDGDDAGARARVVEKLRPLATYELARAERDRKLLGVIRERQHGKPAIATPQLSAELEDLDGLAALAAHLVGRGEDTP